MEVLITEALALASQVLQLINTAEAMKYVNQLTSLKLDLQKEKSKGYDSDDSKVENLQEQISIILKAVQDQLTIFANAKLASPAPIVTASPK